MKKTAENSLDESLSLGTFIRKSPFVEGLKTGLKAGVAGAGLGAGYGALAHKGARAGATVGGLGSLLLGALVGSAVQEVKNRQAEADMSYHIRRILGRHPLEMVPPGIAARLSQESDGAVVGPESQRAFETYSEAPRVD